MHPVADATTPRDVTETARNRRKTAHRCGGAFALEYTLILLVFAALMGVVAEIYRLSLVDQVLARATHEAATAAGTNPDQCEQAAQTGFAGGVASWLFDHDDSGAIGFVMGAGPAPDGSPLQEVRLEIAADDRDLGNGVDFNAPNCGVEGSLIRVRSTVPVRRRFGTGTILWQHESLAVNQR